MDDKAMFKKAIEIVTEDSFAKEFDLLRWLFKKYEEAEEKENAQN